MAYVTREPASAERQLTYITHTAREDLVFAGSRNLPAFSASNAYVFFEASEKYERINGVAFEEFKITLPVELTMDQNKALAKDMIDAIAGNSLPCAFAFHNPKTLDEASEQPHLHLLISARQTDGIERTAAQHFKRYNAEHPERGGAQKEKAMNVYHATKLHRLMISDILNMHLEFNGQVARVHPDSLKERGITREPEPKLLPSESAAYRETGVVEPDSTIATVLRIRQERAAQPPHEQNNARQYWEQRKAFLGITRDMPQDVKIAHILLKRHGAVERVPERYRRHLERQQPRQKTPDLAQHFQRLARQLTPSEEHGHGHLHIRLHDQERGLEW